MKTLSLLILAAGLFSAATSKASTTEPVSKTKTDSAAAKNIVLDDAVAMDALHEFRSLSRVDRKMRLSQAKQAFKDFKAERRAGGDVSTNTILLVILAILLPPLAVYLHEGTINGRFWLSLLLTLLFWLPGVIYALIVVLG